MINYACIVKNYFEGQNFKKSKFRFFKENFIDFIDSLILFG